MLSVLYCFVLQMHSTKLRFPGREQEAENRSIIFRKSCKTGQFDGEEVSSAGLFCQRWQRPPPVPPPFIPISVGMNGKDTVPENQQVFPELRRLSELQIWMKAQDTVL